MRNLPISYDSEDAERYRLWTTVVICSNSPFDVPLYGFNYPIGGDIPGLSKVPACHSETNQKVVCHVLNDPTGLKAGHFLDNKMWVTAVAWHVPAIALGKFQKDGKDYTVTREDVAELVRNVVLAVHVETTVHTIPLRQTDAEDYGGDANLGMRSFGIGRVDAFYVRLSFKGPLEIGGTLPLIITLKGQLLSPYAKMRYWA
jgi:hypothetical protein